MQETNGGTHTDPSTIQEELQGASEEYYVVQKGDTLAPDQQKALWDNFRNGCNLQDEWIKRWQSDIHRTEIVIAIKVWYDRKSK